MGFVLCRKTMTRVMLLLIVTMTWFVAGDAGGTKPEERLFNIEKLEMFVDKLPHIPTLHGFHIVNGVLKPKSLQIGMFFKKWVFSFLFLSFFLFFLTLFLVLLLNLIYCQVFRGKPDHLHLCREAIMAKLFRWNIHPPFSDIHLYYMQEKG